MTASALRLPSCVAQPAGEEFGNRRGRLADAFDQSHHHGAGAYHGYKEDRQQAVYHLAGDVHEHADKAERPHAARNGCKSGFRFLFDLSRFISPASVTKTAWRGTEVRFAKFWAIV